MLPISMVGGAVFAHWMEYITFLSPYLIFMMLLITYCRVDPREFRPSRFQWMLLSVQMLMATAVWFALIPMNRTVAQGIFICVFIPTATAAPVITGMLGGSISKLATYSLLCNLVVALTGPVILALIGDHPDITFSQSLMLICTHVIPLLILPIVAAMLLDWFARPVHSWLKNHQGLSFYIWAVSLFIVVGSSVSFVINNYTFDKTLDIVLLAAGALVVCLLQFWIGRKVGRKYGDTVSGGQALGQKNTLLAVWISLAYLNPISSIAPAAYVAWQNIINSWQIMKRQQN